MLITVIQPPLMLAQKNGSTSEIFFWLGVIVVLAFVLGFIALWLRKKLMTVEVQIPVGFTLKDLRELHAKGQLSDEELAAAEAKALAKSRSHYLGATLPHIEEAEDIGHLSTSDEAESPDETENSAGSSDKNADDRPSP